MKITPDMTLTEQLNQRLTGPSCEAADERERKKGTALCEYLQTSVLSPEREHLAIYGLGFDNYHKLRAAVGAFLAPAGVEPQKWQPVGHLFYDVLLQGVVGLKAKVDRAFANLDEVNLLLSGLDDRDGPTSRMTASEQGDVEVALEAKRAAGLHASSIPYVLEASRAALSAGVALNWTTCTPWSLETSIRSTWTAFASFSIACNFLEVAVLPGLRMRAEAVAAVTSNAGQRPEILDFELDAHRSSSAFSGQAKALNDSSNGAPLSHDDWPAFNWAVINPATALPMGEHGVDIGGSVYGQDINHTAA